MFTGHFIVDLFMYWISIDPPIHPSIPACIHHHLFICVDGERDGLIHLGFFLMSKMISQCSALWMIGI